MIIAFLATLNLSGNELETSWKNKITARLTDIRPESHGSNYFLCWFYQLIPGSTRRSDRRCGQQPQKTQRTLLSECRTESTISNQATTKTTNSSTESKLGASLIPKLSRLQPNEISNAMQGSGQSGMFSFCYIFEVIVMLIITGKFKETHLKIF